MTTASPSTASPALSLTPVKGLLILLALVVVISAFLAVTHALGLREVWAAFLFLLYWAGIEHAAPERLPAGIIGAALGLLMGYLLHTLPAALGLTPGLLVFLALVLVMVYCQIMRWLPLAVNLMAMLYLTVTAIPHLQSGVDFAGAFLALLAGVVYFAGLVLAGHWWQKRKAAAG